MKATLALTTRARVAEFAKISAFDDAWEQEVVDGMIDAASAYLEAYCGRWFKKEARTVEIDVPDGGMRTLQLRAAPIDTGETFTLKNDAEWDWSSTTAIATTEYHVAAARGRVRFKRTHSMETGPGALQVVYTGGIAADTATILTAAPGLVAACLLTVVEMWNKRRTALRSGSISKQGFSVEEPALEVPKAALQMAQPWKLWNGVG